MNYIWEAALDIKAAGDNIVEYKFIPSSIADPYREVVFENINSQYPQHNKIEVNAYYRFNQIFSSCLGEEMEHYPVIRDFLFDILFQMLCDSDLRQGLSREEFYRKFLLEDLDVGVFGEKNSRMRSIFSHKEIVKIAGFLVTLYKTGTSHFLIQRVFRTLYPSSIIYIDKREDIEVLLYIGCKETPRLQSQVNLLLDFFLPAGYEVELFWDKHFGIIGVPETMQIDEIMIF